MLGSKQTLEMIESAKRDNCRMVLLGDVKQLPAIDAGRAFQDAQELGQLHVVRLEESIRQKTEYTRQLVEAIKDKDIDSAQQILESNNRITEIADRDERLNAVKEAYLEKGGVDNGTHIITSTNADRKALNEMIRTEIKEERKLTSEQTFTIREIVSMKEIEKRYAYNYEENQILYAQKSFNGMNPGMESRIIGIDQTNNFLNCKTVDGKDLFIDVAQNGDKIRIFNEASREFAAGDHIVFLKNDKYLQVQNGLTGTIKNIDENGNLSLDINGKDITLNIKNYNYIDHAYAITTHKSQGASYNNDIYCAKTDNVDQKQFYVAASRSRLDFEIFVDDKERFFENVKTEQQKSSTLDYIQDNKREQKLESEIQIDDKESHNEIKSSVQQEQSLEQEKPRFREMEMEL
jgi:ATP-dependent exoDNAse (exonuclease V) alpha subunit